MTEVAEWGTALPFNKMKQRAILGHLLTDRAFFLQCRHHVKPAWFTEEKMNGKVYAIQLSYFAEYQRFPTQAEVEAHPEVMSEPLAVQKQIANQIRLCTEETKNFALEALRVDLTDWLHAVLYREGIEKATQWYNKGNFKEVAQMWNEVSKRVREVRFDSIGESSFETFEQDFQDEIDGRQGALTTGLQIFDEALIDGAISGGLQRGDTTILLAPVNTGKTTAMISMIVHNIKRGADVLFLTHEGRDRDIKTKIWQSMMGLTKKELFALYRDPKGSQRLRIMMRYIEEHLKYLPFNKPGMCVEDVEPVIRRAQETKIAKTGKGYDLVVSDYPAKLSTTRASKGNLPRREIDRIVYDYFVQMGLEHNFHVLCAIQTNREGSKINKGKEDRLLAMEDVSEAWGPMEMATSVISINRSPRAMAEGRVTFYVCKSRSSATGTAIVCRSRYDCATTHSENLGAVSYRDSVTMDEKVNDLLDKYKGHQIPEHLVYV